jgi:stage II sporulation protein AA (anti-sigma F factor antagonist)
MADELDILSPQGRLDSESSPDLAKQALDMIDKGSRRLLLDFKDLYYVSSAGLRAALAVAKRMSEVGGKVAIASVSPQVAEVMDVSGLVMILDVHTSAESARARLLED